MAWRSCLLFGWALLALRGALTIEVQHVAMNGMMFCQKDASPAGQYSFTWDREEEFDVDLERQETVFRQQRFEQYASFDAQGGLQQMAVCNYNLDIYIERSKGESGPTAEPKVTVYTEEPVELGVPNTLICYIDEFFPAVLNVTWYKNRNPVYEGVTSTDLYPRDDAYFRRFVYLSFIPEQGDIYSCSVEHPSHQTPVITFWEHEEPSPEPETTETVVCALGLVVGIIGIITGTLLVIKGMKRSDTQRRRGL